MFKVLIWDHTGESSKWCEHCLEKAEVKIVQTITPAELVPEILLKKDAWDWLLIFERNMRKSFDQTIQVLKLPPEKVIYVLDAGSWVKHPKAIYTLLNSSKWGKGIFRHLNIHNFRVSNDFFMCTVENLSYIAPSEDRMRITNMFVNQTNWASNEMKRFQELAKQYYNVDDSTGYFLDLGANIGTTGLYFIKKLTPNLKLLAFEPDPENFKMHRINMILNDLEESTTLVNCGLGNETTELMLYRRMPNNSGGNTFIKYDTATPIANIKVLPLDSYLAENKIAASEVKYIWIDTEGFEPQVLLGARNLLKENPAPVFVEYNLVSWSKSGLFEDMMTLLSEQYSHFIHLWQGETLHPLEALRNMEKKDYKGDIFLIKKGAID